MITIYAFINVLCLAGQIYFLWKVLKREFNWWVVPFILTIVSYFVTSFNYVEVIYNLPVLNETNVNVYSTLTAYISLNYYVLMINVLVFVIYLVISLIIKAVEKAKSKTKF